MTGGLGGGCSCDDPDSVPPSDLLPLSAPSGGLRPAEDVSQVYGGRNIN